MLSIFTNNFIEFSTYSSNFVLPFINYLPIALYITAVIWSLSLILLNHTSTRVNSVTAKFRTNVSVNLINLYKL